MHPGRSQSLLSSIHDGKVAMTVLKGDKKQESVVYTASCKKEVSVYRS